MDPVDEKKQSIYFDTAPACRTERVNRSTLQFIHTFQGIA